MAEVLGAVAAGTQLFDLAATALLKTVRLVKDLRDVPHKMAVLLADVEKSTTRVQYILNDVLQPGSKVLEQLNATQADNLTKAATELHQAMNDVNVILTPLVGSQTSGKSKLTQRIWRAVVAVKVEKDVTEKLERVGRLNNEVTQQLGITKLELQAAASVTAGNHKSELIDVVETSSRNLQTTIHEKHTFTTTQLSNIASMTWDAQYVMTGVRDSVVATNIGLSRVAEDTTSIRHALATLTDRDQATPISRQEMQDMMSQHASRTDIELLRDEILLLLTRQTSDLPVSSWTGSHNLSKADQRNVQESARQQLLMRHSSLAEAKAALQRDESHVARSCRCRLSRRYRDSRFWRLSFRAEESSEHRRGCPYANSGVRSWSYSARAALTPFLNFTLELAIGATMKGRSWSMAPPLRFYGTVKRSESPLFRAFDRLPSLCIKNVWQQDGRIIYSHDPGRYTARDYSHLILFNSVQMRRFLPRLKVMDSDWFELYYVEWDQDTTKQQLVDLCGQVRSEIEGGNASAADSDEDGLTLLFSLVDLLLLFRRNTYWSLFSAEFQSLFQIIVDSGVDMAALAPYDFETGLDNDLPRRTACDNLLELLSRSALDYLEHISVLWEPMVAFVTPKSASRSLLSNRVELLLRSFQLAESAEELGILNDEEMAVLHRRPSVLKRHSVHWSKHDGHTVMNGPGFEPTQLALGWDTGLRYLVAAHCPVERAIVTTCILGDQESLRILLQTPRPVFSASSIMPDNDQESWIEKAVDRLYWRSPASYTGFDLILTELIRRRNILKHLALTELSSLQQREFGLDEPSIPDSQSEAIFHCLKQIIHVPDELDCWISPHHMIRKCDDMPAKLLDKIYNAGFRSVDIPYKGETPLFWRLARDAAYQFSCTHLDYLPWFLSHGARAEWSDVSQLDNTRYPTALFYIGPILRFNYQYHSQLLKACEDSSLWVPTNLHLITDDCTCLCGTRGCLASHLLWRCTARNCFCFSETMRWRLEVLKRWISVWRLSGHEKEIVYSEVTRLELFERLGMAHTCCCTKLPDCWTDWKPIRRLCPDEEERARLRDEDSELALQLDDLLAQYDIARKAHGGSIESFWRHWWQVLNEILPPLLPVAACKNRLLGPWHRSSEDSQEEYRKRNQETIENRAAQEQEALKCAGYIGPEYEDFRQVIRVHLSGRDWDPSVFDDADSEEWEMCSSGTDTNASEATDEDERAHGNAR